MPDVARGEAQDEKLESYCKLAYRRCCEMLRDFTLAEDIMQEVMFEFLKRRNQERIRHPPGFIYRTATRRCIDLLRRSHRQDQAVTELAYYLELAAPQQEKSPEVVLLIKLMKDRFSEEMELLLYRHYDGMTYNEIGDLLSISGEAVRKRIQKAELTIRKAVRR